MSPRRASRLAWSLAALAVLLVAASVPFVVLGWGIETPAGGTDIASAGFVVAFIAFPAVGALVASRRPSNPIGWLFCAGGIAGALDSLGSAYADYALFAKPGSLPGGAWAAWVSASIEALFIVTPPFVLLLFPDGRLVSRRWRPAVWILAAGLAAGIVSTAFKPGIIRDDLPIDNPLGVDAVGTVVDALGVVLWLCVVATYVAGATSMIVRLRRARGDLRQQVKWIAFSAALMAVGFIAVNLGDWAGGAGQAAAGLFFSLSIAAVPVAAGIAILRHRLYEIDLIIRRTVVYAVLTSGLAGLYLGMVVALQQVFSGFAGGSDLAVAGSTLAVAALFRPVRSRLQAVVDRRFYRRRYDAQRTIEAFSARLRDEVDLEALEVELRAAVREAMQPAHVSLWLRPQEAKR
jgi:hypothetical protein